MATSTTVQSATPIEDSIREKVQPRISISWHVSDFRLLQLLTRRILKYSMILHYIDIMLLWKEIQIQKLIFGNLRNEHWLMEG
jgi:hypothetical protein